MSSIQPRTTVLDPSHLALPTRGHAFATSMWAGVSAVVRGRRAAVVTDGSGLGKAYIPGTSAWRPPIC